MFCRTAADAAANPGAKTICNAFRKTSLVTPVTQKRLKLSPTLFIATLDSELDVISVCNLSGEVIKETLGTRNRDVLAPSLADFLTRIEPLL